MCQIGKIMGEGKGLIEKVKGINEYFNNLEKNFDVSKSKKAKKFGKACIFIGLSLVSFNLGYCIGKTADYVCKKITNKQIYEHIREISLPTEPKRIYNLY